MAQATSFSAGEAGTRALDVAGRMGISRSALIEGLLRAWLAGEVAHRFIPQLPEEERAVVGDSVNRA